MILILEIHLVGAIGMSATMKPIYLPIIIGGNVRCTPTLAPTMCAGWYEHGVCSPTATPYVICLPVDHPECQE